MALKLASTTRNALANAIGTLLTAGGSLKIYTGSAPTNPEDAASGTMLVTFTLPTPVFGSASGGIITANTVSDATASNSGTAGYYRVFNNGGNVVWQGDVSVVGGGATLQLDTTTITSGNLVHISTWTVTQAQS